MTDLFKREGVRSLEFLLSEANGSLSRETGTLKEGEVAKPGSILAWDTGKLIIADGDDTSGVLDDDTAGIAAYAVDATDSDMPITYIARYAEVSDEKIEYPTGKKVILTASLKDLGIITREGNTVPSA